jgi:hypothetical protein
MHSFPHLIDFKKNSKNINEKNENYDDYSDVDYYSTFFNKNKNPIENFKKSFNSKIDSYSSSKIHFLEGFFF